jgi:c-di-GMP-binding flagellar brake protein YcgR
LPADSPDLHLISEFGRDLENGHFIIGAPVYKSGLYPISLGSVIFINYFKSRMRYDFQGIVRDRFKHDDLYYLTVERTTDILRTQRREDFRLDLMVDVTLSWDEADENGFIREVEVAGLTHDVSGGGAAVCVNTQLRDYERVRIKLLLPDLDESLCFDAETRWVTRRDSDSEFRYLCGLKFLFDSKLEKSNLIKQIFRIQQQRMRIDSLNNLSFQVNMHR